MVVCQSEHDLNGCITRRFHHGELSVYIYTYSFCFSTHHLAEASLGVNAMLRRDRIRWENLWLGGLLRNNMALGSVRGRERYDSTA